MMGDDIGSQRVERLQYPFSATLTHLDRVMTANHTVVVYEVILSLRRYPHLSHFSLLLYVLNFICLCCCFHSQIGSQIW
jgi:hypothetical protein